MIAVTTLADVCRQHAPAAFHFLKIDVEGAEAQVLAGADFAEFRPWIVVVEATRPLSQADASAAWEPALLAARYRFAWFDGLNRFYVADERWDELGQHFRAPPNVFDGFIVHAPQDRVHAELLHAGATHAGARELANTRDAAVSGSLVRSGAGVGWAVAGALRKRSRGLAPGGVRRRASSRGGGQRLCAIF